MEWDPGRVEQQMTLLKAIPKLIGGSPFDRYRQIQRRGVNVKNKNPPTNSGAYTFLSGFLKLMEVGGRAFDVYRENRSQSWRKS